MTRKFTAIVSREGDFHVARCAEIVVASQGTTVDEAVANLREATELRMADDQAVEPQAQVSPSRSRRRHRVSASRGRDCRGAEIVRALERGGSSGGDRGAATASSGGRVRTGAR